MSALAYATETVTLYHTLEPLPFDVPGYRRSHSR